MGNCGATVYNSTDYSMHIVLTMGIIHYYCNSLKPGEGFTIYPGAVWHTFGCIVDTGKNKIKSSDTIINLRQRLDSDSVLGIVSILIGSDLPLYELLSDSDLKTISEKVFNKTFSLSKSCNLGKGVGILTTEADSVPVSIIDSAFTLFRNTALDCVWGDETKGVYCGGSHKIIVISGGAYNNGKEFIKQDIRIQEVPRLPVDKNNINYRKREGLGHKPFEYWTQSDGNSYPPRNINN
jgi:hypothetical protein